MPGGGAPTQFAPVEDAYASLGVHFGNSLESDDPATANFRWITIPTDFIIRDNSRGASGELGFHILATFDKDLQSVSALPKGPTGLFASITMSAYDVTGALLASVTEAQVTPTSLALLDVGAIRSVSWVTDKPFNNSPQLDNLIFTAIPEPTSLTLFTLGVIGMGLLRRRAHDLGDRQRL